MTYKEARVYLDEMSKYGSVLGLDTIRGLLRELGNPQDDLKFIHIAGTNGKGSVLAYTSTILSEAGYRTGRYVSPTVISYLERIQIDGTWISEDEFAELAEKVKEAIARMEAVGEESPTVFEAETAIAFLYFKKKNCDLVVLESGLGGILDATNIIGAPVCAAFATISVDHLGVIGNSLEEIAQNKAGIIKSGCAVVSAKQKENVREILERTAEENNCSFTEAQPEQMIVHEDSYRGITFSYKDYEQMRSSLVGQCQRENLATALEIIRCLNGLGYQISQEQVRNGLLKTNWIGRFTCLFESPLFFIDGAHNEDAALKLKMSLERYFSDYKKILIMGVFKDKEYDKITSLLCPLAEYVYTVNLPNAERTLPAEQLAEVVEKHCQRVKAEPTIEAAVKDAIASVAAQEKDSKEKTVILACGSLSYLGEVQRIVQNNRQ
ncbi:bifunctional folylpolyglutamate synthase/dihydrofolate synthase [Mediterraneibacter faecis]|uniref:bifunctional folylpolyglutamate synthase/dihydrofolate synthase n=1 Tax=Mediterraneibacter faecis TaxID=592978 RepID=UPI003D012A29